MGLVPNCPGAKLSTFIILVPNCPLLLSWCQIVPFIILVPNCPVPNCPMPNCPTIRIRYHIFYFKHIHPQNEKHFYYLGAKLSAFIILVPNCPLYYLGAKLSGAKLSPLLS